MSYLSMDLRQFNISVPGKIGGRPTLITMWIGLGEMGL